MRRILAEVIEKNELPGTAPGEDGMPWKRVRCLVKMLSPVPESHHLPADIKDTTCTIERPAVFDHEYKPGTRVILAPEECEPYVRRPCDIPELGSLKGRAVTYKTDVNGDGFAERVMENAFLRVVIGPRFGARIWEIWHKRRNVDPLFQSYEFGESHIELGGVQDHFDEQAFPGEFWNAEFPEKEVVCDDQGCRVRYEFASEKNKGITFIKEIRLPADSPLVYFSYTFKYAGAEKPPEDGKPDEFELSMWPRVGVEVPDETKDDYVVLVPTKEKMRRQRYSLAYWGEPPAYNMSAPYNVIRNEETGLGVALLADQKRVKRAHWWHGHGFSTMEPRYEKVKIPKDGEESYGHALLIADSVNANKDGAAFVTIGPEEAGMTPVFALTTRDCPGPARLVDGSIEASVEMSEINFDYLPAFHGGTNWIENARNVASFSEMNCDGECWTLESGGEE